MCIYVSASVLVHVHACPYICAPTYERACTNGCVYLRVRTCMRVCVCIHMCVRKVRVCVHEIVCVFACVHACGMCVWLHMHECPSRACVRCFPVSFMKPLYGSYTSSILLGNAIAENSTVIAWSSYVTCSYIPAINW